MKAKFALWVLRDGRHNTRQYLDKSDAKRVESFDKVCELLDRESIGDSPSSKEWSDASAYAYAEEYYLASSKELLRLLKAT